jgi:lipopolysaccharide/colanic/teichoic acid biosynthesis glycosyltransferase
MYKSFFKRLIDFLVALAALPFLLLILAVVTPDVWLNGNICKTVHVLLSNTL